MQGWRNEALIFKNYFLISYQQTSQDTATGLGFTYILFIKIKKLEPSDYIAFTGILLVYISAKFSKILLN